MEPLSSSEKSTSVRSAGVPAWVRVGMQGLEALWPPLATRVAERMLLTPLQHRRPARERVLLERSRPVQAVGPLGVLRGHAWGAGPPVLLVHGWAGRGTQLAAFAAPLVAAGHEVLAYDLPGHGGSDGERVSLLDFRDAVIAIGRQHGPLFAAIAHSMGGAAAALAAADGLRVERLVLVASPASLREQTRRFAATLGLSDDVYARVTARLEARLGATMESIEIETIAARIAADTLVVHDAGDDEVDPAHADRIARALPRARVHATYGLGHNKVLRDPGVVGVVAEFITGRPPIALDLDALLERELFDRDARGA